MGSKPPISLGLALFLLFQGLFGLTASGRVDRVADEFEVYMQTESLWDRGSQAIPQIPEAVFFGKVGLDGEQYAPYGPASAVLALPFHGAGRLLAWAVGVERSATAPWTELVAAVTSLASTTWAALAVLGLFAAAQALGATPRRAAILALLLGTTTLLWPAATLFYSEPQSAALLIWAFAFQLRGRSVWAAAAAWVLLLIKASNLILVPIVGALVLGAPALWTGGSWPDRARRASAAIAPLAFAVYLAGLVHLDWNLTRFGDPFEFGFAWHEVMRPGEAPAPFMLSELPRGLFGLLLSPGKSLFLYAPVLALAAARAPALRAARPAVALAWGTALVVPLLYFGAYFHWEGGYSFGPRHLTPLIPVLILPLALGALPRLKILKGVAALGLVVQLFGVSVSYMEDQGLGTGDRPRPSLYYERHSPDSREVPAGRPLVRYRMHYEPFSGYTAIALRHLSSFDPGGGPAGLEFLPLRLLRVRATRPDGEAIPAWLGWWVWALCGVAFAAGARVTALYLRV